MSSNAPPTISVAQMRAAVISPTTYENYKHEVWRLLEYGCDPERAGVLNWFTPAAVTKYHTIASQVANTRGRSPKAQVRWAGLLDMLRSCHDTPILNIAAFTVEGYMMYLQSQRDENGNFFKASAYAAKRSALFHLFRSHPNLEGYPPDFEPRLKTLMTGFLRTVVTHRANAGVDDDDGKKPMSVDLYRALCGWLFHSGQPEDIFAYCFLALTWNLMCRSNNTCRIHLSHIGWINDSMVIRFAQQKGDQMGLTEKFPRHLYANPVHHITCPVFAIGVYLTLFGNEVDPNSRLFPGKSQYKRFSDRLKPVLREHEDEVIAMGYESINDIGTHSIRKGATKFLGGQPGGPPTIAICIRGGWSLGGVKDVYMTYEAEGDHFCGRMLTLLPLLTSSFAASPPVFDANNCTPEITEAVNITFPAFRNCPALFGLLHKCLATLVHNKDMILDLPLTHHCRQSIALFRHADLLDNLSSHVNVFYPWSRSESESGPLSFGSGIPPHVALLVTQQVMILNLDNFVSGFDNRMNRIFDERSVAGGVSVASLREVINGELRTSLIADLRAEIQRYGYGGPTNRTTTNSERDRSTNRSGYQPHYYDGAYHKVPKGWRIPLGNLKNFWIAYTCGDTVNNVPPLRFLQAGDVRHIDREPRQSNEPKRKSTKLLSDVHFLGRYIIQVATDAGKFEETMTQTELGSCLDDVATAENGLLSGNQRNTTLNWQTACGRVRKLVKSQRNATETS